MYNCVTRDEAGHTGTACRRSRPGDPHSFQVRRSYLHPTVRPLWRPSTEDVQMPGEVSVMRKGSILAAAAIASTAVLLTGCSMLDQIVGADSWKDWAPSQTSLQVYGDGSVTETILDSLDQDWYTGDELQDMIARSMNEYNAQNGAEALNVTEYSDEGGQVRVKLVYRTGDDYSRYNDVVFFNGSMLDAEMAGFLFTGPFSSVDGSQVREQGVDAAEPLSHKEYSVTVTDGMHAVQVPGTIRYISSNGAVVNSHTAQPASAAGEAQTEGDSTYLSGDPGTGSVSDKERDASYLYIIYEKDQEADLLPSDLQAE